MDEMQGIETHLTTENIQVILWCYDKGSSIHDLAKRFNCGHGKIENIIRDHGILRPPRPKKILDELDQFDGKICKGMSYREYLLLSGYKN